MINIFAFIVGFLNAFHQKTETVQYGKTIYYDGVPVTGIVKGEK